MAEALTWAGIALCIAQCGIFSGLNLALFGVSRLRLEADAFQRDALFRPGPVRARAYCHRPIVVKDPRTPLGRVIERLHVRSERAGDDVIDQDPILLWDTEKRVVTGSDILGRLLRGIVGHDTPGDE